MTDQHPTDTEDALVKMARQANKAIFYRSIAIIAVVLLGVVGWYAASQYTNAQDASRAAKEAAILVRQSALANCEKSVQPGGVRRIIADQIQYQIDQSKSFDAHQFFPNVPPKQLDELLQEQRRQQEKQIHDLLSVNCPALFPLP